MNFLFFFPFFNFFFFLRFFSCGPFLKSLLNFLQYCFSFMLWVFGHRILAPQPGMEPSPPALKGEVLTSGLPGSPYMNAQLRELKEISSKFPERKKIWVTQEISFSRGPGWVSLTERKHTSLFNKCFYTTREPLWWNEDLKKCLNFSVLMLGLMKDRKSKKMGWQCKLSGVNHARPVPQLPLCPSVFGDGGWWW